MKTGRLECRAYLEWVRKQPCRACIDKDPTAQAAAGEAHHFPPKGMGGANIRDDMTIPLCRKHHDAAQRYEIRPGVQDLWADETRIRFLEEAPVEMVCVYLAAFECFRSQWRPAIAVPF